MASAFVVGETARLRSGGPLMTVTRVGSMYDQDEIGCGWFVGIKQQTGEFPAGALEKATKSSGFFTVQTART